MVTGTLGIDRAMRLIQVASNANVKRACMAAENIDVGAAHSKMLARFLVLSSREKPVGARRLKSSEQHG